MLIWNVALANIEGTWDYLLGFPFWRTVFSESNNKLATATAVYKLSLFMFQSRRKRPRTPTPGNYLGVRSTREVSSYYDRDRRRGNYGRDGYNSRRSPRRSPYHEGRGYSPRHSPYRGSGSRRDRTRSPPYSPYESPVRSRGHRSYSERSR